MDRDKQTDKNIDEEGLYIYHENKFSILREVNYYSPNEYCSFGQDLKDCTGNEKTGYSRFLS